MYVLISVTLISFLIFGIIFDYVSTLRERYKANKSLNITKYQKLTDNGLRILNGRTILPLTVLSSIVCLERTINALTELIKLQPSNHHQETLADINKSLVNFQALPPSHPYFYALLQVPTTISEQVLMLRQSILLAIILNSEHTKGRINVENLRAEVEQLGILNARLKAACLSVQAMQQLEYGGYSKAKIFIDSAMALLQGVDCDNQEVTALLAFEIEKMNMLKDKVDERIEKITQLNAEIGQKKKGESPAHINKKKYSSPDEEFIVFEGNNDDGVDDDGLHRIFDNGNKTKY